MVVGSPQPSGNDNDVNMLHESHTAASRAKQVPIIGWCAV